MAVAKSTFGKFLYYVILTISYLRACSIVQLEMSSLPSDSARLLFKQIDIFSGMLTGYLNFKYFPLYMCKLLGCFLWICPSRGIPVREIIYIEATLNQRLFKLQSL